MYIYLSDVFAVFYQQKFSGLTMATSDKDEQLSIFLNKENIDNDVQHYNFQS